VLCHAADPELPSAEGRHAGETQHVRGPCRSSTHIASDVIGTAGYEHTDSRGDERDGSRPRILATQAGDNEVRLPPIREGVFLFPDPPTAPPYRPGAVHSGDGGLPRRRIHPRCRWPCCRVGVAKSVVSRTCCGPDEVVTASAVPPGPQRLSTSVSTRPTYTDATHLAAAVHGGRSRDRDHR
jgi:hypothetical protein